MIKFNTVILIFKVLDDLILFAIVSYEGPLKEMGQKGGQKD